MARASLKVAIEQVGREKLEPKGFILHARTGSRPALYAFLRPWRRDLLQGIGIYQTIPKARAFQVELGIVRRGIDFFATPFIEEGRWRQLGLRKPLGLVMYGDSWDMNPDQREMFLHDDRDSLVESVRPAVKLSLEHGPKIWEQLGQDLLNSPA